MSNKNDDRINEDVFEEEDDFDFDDYDYSDADEDMDTEVDINDIPVPDEEDVTPEVTEKSSRGRENIQAVRKRLSSLVKKPEPLTAEERKAKRDREIMARKKRRKAIKKAKRPVLIAIIALICVIFGISAYALSTIDESKVMKNVYIENLNVGGLSYDETLESIKATYLFEHSELTLTNGSKTFTIDGAEIGLSAMPEETAKKAYEYCKTGNIFDKAFKACMLLFKPHVIVPAPQLDEARLDQKLNEAGKAFVGERKQFSVVYDSVPGTATIYSGQTGYDENPSAVHKQVVDAIQKEKFDNIHVDFTTAPPDAPSVELFDRLIYKDPIDARYEINGNELTIIPGETGRYLNKDAFSPLLPNIYEGCEPVSITYNISEPNITEASLREKIFTASLGSYSTNYGGSTANRSKNVARAASLISGKIVAPGEIFSFNDTVGPRSVENGFFTAKEYLNGQSVDGIGGGTCQVSSTLYSAVLYADMSIIERLNHMMSVGYIPLGQDATVSDSGVDFQFKNTSDYPIKIDADTDGSTITVSILGTAWEPDRTVKISNNVSSAGQNTVVHSTRYVYSNNELIATDTLNSSTYMPHS